VLLQEAQVVYRKHGLIKAGMSKAFFTDLVPGLVMAVLFGQLVLLALPLRLALGDAYSPAVAAGQVERLVVVGPATDWAALHPAIRARALVRGLALLEVPSLGPFTGVIEALARRETLRVMDISGHSEVQARVAVQGDVPAARRRLETLPGVRVMFEFRLPTLGRAEGAPGETSLSLELQAVHLLATVRAVRGMQGVTLSQIYDFWG
jgi:hypothetical protein